MYFLTDGERLDGAIIFHISAAIYFFILLAVVCHDYFLPSVECICEDWNISKVFFNPFFSLFLSNEIQSDANRNNYRTLFSLHRTWQPLLLCPLQQLHRNFLRTLYHRL